MVSRSALASAKVSREAGRGSHRRGAFSFSGGNLDANGATRCARSRSPRVSKIATKCVSGANCGNSPAWRLTRGPPPPRFPRAPSRGHRRLMVPRSAPASAEVNREAGRRRYPLGAFLRGPRRREAAGLGSRRATPARARQRGRVRGHDALRRVSFPLLPGYTDDFELSKLQDGPALRGIRRRRAARRHSRGADRSPGRAETGRGGGASRARRRELRVRGRRLACSRSVPPASCRGSPSTITWAGALAWVTVEADRARRGQTLGTVFGFAVAGAIVGPMFGAVGESVSHRGAFTVVGVVRSHSPPPPPSTRPRELRTLSAGESSIALSRSRVPRRPLAQHPARVLLRRPRRTGASRLRPRRLRRLRDRHGVRPRGHRRGLRGPCGRPGLRQAWPVGPDPNLPRRRLGNRRASRRSASPPLLLVAVAVVGAVSFGSLFTPGMALVSDRAELAGLALGLGFGLMNTAWAVGVVLGPTLGGGLAEAFGDPVAYLLCAGLAARRSPRSWAAGAGGRARRAPRDSGAARDRNDESSPDRAPRRAPTERGGKALERPALVEWPTAVVLAADERVVARAWIHRQPGFDRVEAVVPVDQVVHLVEAPRPHLGTPCLREARRRRSSPRRAPATPPAGAVRDPRSSRRSPQADHVGERPAERGEVAVRGGPEVPEPEPQRPAAEAAGSGRPRRAPRGRDASLGVSGETTPCLRIRSRSAGFMPPVQQRPPCRRGVRSLLARRRRRGLLQSSRRRRRRLRNAGESRQPRHSATAAGSGAGAGVCRSAAQPASGSCVRPRHACGGSARRAAGAQPLEVAAQRGPHLALVALLLHAPSFRIAAPSPAPRKLYAPGASAGGASAT